MEVIKKKISLEDGISRRPDATYGTITATTFNTMILLTQTYDNMGIYTDIDYANELPDYTLLIDKLNDFGYTFPFMYGITPPSVFLTGFTACTRVDGANVSDWYADGDIIDAKTSSRLNELRSYNNSSQYVAGFNVDESVYLNYQNSTINGVSQVVNIDSTGDTTYVFDANDDSNLGTTGQTSGLLYIQGPDDAQTSGGVILRNTLNANLRFKAEGWNETNSSLSAITKEEYLMGILYPPEVFSDVFIDRGTTSVMEGHLKLSEIKGVEQLEKYGGGFYNIIKT